MASWETLLGAEKSAPYFLSMQQKISQARANGTTIFPPSEQVFTAFELTPLDQVKVVILGQDPYHGPAQAHGLAFSVQDGVKIPPSLRNMYKELENSVADFEIPSSGNLIHWAQQGVFLLNTVLTVEQGKAHSHARWGWETFTDRVIAALNEHTNQVVFLLWGAHAQKKGALINRDRHFVLEAPHPSPLSAHRGFFGCDHFLQTNQLLTSAGKAPIKW